MSKLPKEQTVAPGFKLSNQKNKERNLNDYAGKWLVLYFYPKDNTSGCTTEAKEFTELKRKFSTKKAAIAGVSPDSIASHQRFIEKHELKIELLSDPDKTMSKTYGVWQKKKMAGREYMGIVRSTFLIDPDGKIQKIWTKVKVKAHVQNVLDSLNELQHI